MKAFICGIITLTTLIAAVITNTIFITKKTDIIINEIESLPEYCASADLSALSREWNDIRSFISLTVHRENIDDIDDTIEQLVLSVSSRNEQSYLYQKTKLLCIAKRLKKTESFSLSRIF